MKSSSKLQNKLWQLASRWLPPFYVPLEPGSQPPAKDESRRLYLDFNFEGLINKLWLFSFGWLDLLFLPPPRRDQRGRITSVPKHRQFVLPVSQAFATNVALIAIGAFGVVYFTFFAGSAPKVENSFSASPPPEVSVEEAGLSRSEPVAIRVPRIGINAKTSIALGLKSDGSLETPKQYEVVGWYTKAPTPGEIGPAVLVGHVDNYLGPAVFYRLSELKPGDVVEVDRADGKTVKFKVQGLERYPQSDFPTNKVYGNLDYAGLRLITCGGQFNALSGRYSDNTVVYASALN